MDRNNMHEINQLFLSVFDNANILKGAKLTSDIPYSVRNTICASLPEKLSLFLKDSTCKYSLKGSVGAGRATKTPWIAVLDEAITKTTREGVYIVFLFSSDYKHVYITLNQGTTVPGQFGLRLGKKEVIRNSEKVRKIINSNNQLLSSDGNADIADDRYKAGAIYYTLWNVNDDEAGHKLLNLYLDIYKKYKELILNTTDNNTPIQTGVIEEEMKNNIPTNLFSIESVISLIRETGLVYSDNLIKRFAFSLMSKRFLILSGLAGSGKTQLALAFASALVKSKEKQMCVVSVGADWTNREPLLGFPNALQSGKYVKPESGVLDLLIEANKPENADKPFFLILDEMNMSYVERYFADFLSAMESKEPISLWNPDEAKGEDGKVDPVPQRVALPKNLFTIGTINVDETTYMFSPKVLDRANVIEFKIAEKEMAEFLKDMKEIDRESINGKAAGMGANFVQIASSKELAKNTEAVSTLQKFFNELKGVNAEFGYRSATEIFRFICQAKGNDDATPKLTDAEILDAAIVQKLLPKLHGSRKKLEPVLSQLWKLCFTGAGKDLNISKENIEKAEFKESADKIRRMYESATANGFTSFAEA